MNLSPEEVDKIKMEADEFAKSKWNTTHPLMHSESANTLYDYEAAANIYAQRGKGLQAAATEMHHYLKDNRFVSGFVKFEYLLENLKQAIEQYNK